MSLWLILGTMTALALALVLLPILRRPGAATARRDYDLGVYRAQLEELEREAERGLLGPDEARAARLEVERRMLAADAESRRERPARPRAGDLRWATALVLLLALPAVSAAVYWRLGRPDLPAVPFAERTDRAAAVATAGAGEPAKLPSVETMIARLEERVAAQPDDLEAWLRLGRAYQLIGEPAKAVEAYQHALSLDEGNAELHAALAEAEIQAAGGIVTEKARSALERTLELEPTNPRARFYQGLALVERGERPKAFEVWKSLIRDTPADAPYLPALRERASALAQDLGLDPAQALPEPAPAAALAEAAREQLPTDPEALRAEAARLETALGQNPQDWQGWIRLARAYAAQQQLDAAEAALGRGAEVYAGAPFLRQQFVAAANELGIAAPGAAPGATADARGPSAEQMRAAQNMSPAEQTEMIRGMVGGLAARLADRPDDVEGWRMLARSYRVLGDKAKAAEAAKRVATLLPDDPVAQTDYAETLLALERADAPLSAEAVSQLERVVELDPANPEALFFLGRAAAERGDAKEAAGYWQRLLAQMPADAPQRAKVQALIDRLPANN